MENFKFYTFSTALVLLLSGCGGTPFSAKPKEGADVIAQTVSVTVLGTTQGWQKDPVQKTWIEADSYCQSLSLEGNSDWRLPSSKEFFALLDTNQSIDALFPKASTIKEFWSSSETSFDINKAWKISAWSNSESYTDKSKVLGVRCIRGEMLSTHNFIQESTTLRDTMSSGKELRWQDDKDASNILLTYDEAKNYCQAKSQRLPNIFELQNMIDKQNLTSPFQNLNNSDFTPYWSNTQQPTNQTQFLTLNFMTGGVNFSDKNAKNFARCVKYINHSPTVTIIQTAVVDEDSQTTIILEGIDSDNDTLSVNITKMPDHGTYTNNIYTPQANYHGTDTIKYKVFDGEFESEEATVNITINSINDAPVANNINTSTNEDISKDITLSFTDIDSSTFTYTVTNPSHGTLTGTAPDLIYTPNANYNGLDSFKYIVNDGINDSNEAVVTITIGADNDAPTAVPLTLSTDEDTNLSLTLVGSDPEGSALTYQIITQPTNGSLIGSGSNRTYVPNANYNGTDSFSYRVNDGELDSPVVTVNISISSINDIPVANSMSISTDEDTPKSITLSANDPDDNTTFTYTIIAPSHGTLIGTAPDLIYTPNANFYGTDTFTFYVNDGESNSSQATVDITVASVNDVPIADAGNDVIADEGDNITLDGSNSSDIEGAIIKYLWREGVTELATTASFSKVFTPGSHIITLQVTDSDNLTTQDTVVVTINEASQTSFISHSVTANAKESEWLEMVDLDKDGDLDILSASSGDGGAEVAWYENHGNYGFTEHIITTETNNTKSVRAADMDNDGDLDILYTTHTANASLVLCKNDGSQNFTCNPISNATDSLSFIEIVNQDTQEDNKLDIITASCDNNKVEWLKNSGDGSSFTGPHLVDDTNTLFAIAVHTADFNKDGKADIVAAYNSSARINWYAYNTADNGNFVHHDVADITDVKSLDVADINQDGYDDIIAVSSSDNKVYWYKSTQSTDPTFETAVTVANLTSVNYASAVDMDNDGDLDILSNSYEAGGKIAWYENTGEYTNFPEHIVKSGVDNVKRVFAADMDNDGNMDVVSGDSTGNIVVYENNATDIATLLPKTGDINDGNHGGDYSFSRSDTDNIVTDSLTQLMWQDDEAVGLNPKDWDSLDLENDCNINLGGYSDWRFPNRYELYYLAQKGDTVLDNVFYNISSFLKDYWTSSPNKVYVSFSSAFSKEAKSINYTRCVRGEPIIFNFVRDDVQEVVLDKKHKLMWEDGLDSDDKTASLGWDDAKSLCGDLNYLGYDDWRLPNIHELYSIFNDNGLDLAFKNRGSATDILISSTTYSSSTDKAYGVNANNGLDEQISKSSSLKFRCVRDIP